MTRCSRTCLRSFRVILKVLLTARIVDNYECLACREGDNLQKFARIFNRGNGKNRWKTARLCFVFSLSAKSNDTVYHQKILSKLRRYGTGRVLIQWFIAHLENRPQYVEMRRIRSSFCKLFGGARNALFWDQ